MPGDFTDAATYERVGAAIEDARQPVFYLEIPPFLFATVTDGIRSGMLAATRSATERHTCRAPPPR